MFTGTIIEEVIHHHQLKGTHINMIRRRIISVFLAAAMTCGLISFLPEDTFVSVNNTVYADESESFTVPAYAVEMARRINELRASAGVPALAISPELCSIASMRTQETTAVFSHMRPDGRSCSTALTDAGINYSFFGENIAYGYNSISSVLSGWMNSPGHRANILDPSFECIGIGMVNVNGNCYWTQVFATAGGIHAAYPENIVMGDEAFISRLYTVALERASDPTGASYWIDRLRNGEVTGADVARGFLLSEEFLGKGTSNEDFVETLYLTFFNRGSDPVGKSNWVALLNGGASRQSVIEGFINSVEWYQLCSSYGIASGSSAEPR